MNTKLKVMLSLALLGLVGVFVINFIIEHSSTINAFSFYKLKWNVNIVSATNNVSSAYFVSDDEARIGKFYQSLETSESKVFSQNREDGLVENLIKLLGLDQRGFYVEFGADDGHQTNSRILREFHNWKGILFDSSNRNPKINLFTESITHINVIKIFKKYKIGINAIDLLSIDTDFADYWVLEKILSAQFKPKIVIHEVNQEAPDRCVSVPRLHMLAFWDNHSRFYGASVCAFYCLAIRFDYTMIYCESAGVNCFWVRSDLLKSLLNIEIGKIQKFLNPIVLFKRSRIPYADTQRQWHMFEKCF